MVSMCTMPVIALMFAALLRGQETRLTFGIINGTRVPMEYLCYWLGQVLRNDDRRVIDKTGLKGNYDFTLSFIPELPPGFDKANLPPEFLDRPSIFDALRVQLGLKL